MKVSKLKAHETWEMLFVRCENLKIGVGYRNMYIRPC